jgi:hypothetical protein
MPCDYVKRVDADRAGRSKQGNTGLTLFTH